MNLQLEGFVSSDWPQLSRVMGSALQMKALRVVAPRLHGPYLQMSHHTELRLQLFVIAISRDHVMFLGGNVTSLA
jgi:hypothetical protein